MNRFLFFLLILFLFFSCKEKKENLIAGSEYKYWLCLSNDTKIKSQIFYYFDRAGKWLVFVKDIDGKFNKFNGGDVYFIETWNLINDSVIDIGSEKYKIEILNSNQLILQNNNKKYLRLVSASYIMIPSQYNKKW